MGIWKPFSSDFDFVPEAFEHRAPRRNLTREVTTAKGNPNPYRFKIKKLLSVRRFTIASVHYPDCRNYEGNKVLVFENVPSDKIKNLNYLDPHFSESKAHPSPIARFAPTQQGWEYAVSFCNNA